MSKELTIDDANRFLDFLREKYPEIFIQVSNTSLVNGSIIFFKPAKMSDEDYNKFNEILSNWYIENGFN